MKIMSKYRNQNAFIPRKFENVLRSLFAKNNLQVHRIVTSSKVFLENECRTHRD